MPYDFKISHIYSTLENLSTLKTSFYLLLI